MSDQDDIRNLLGRYCHAADDLDHAGYVACFTPDGVLVEQDIEIPVLKTRVLSKRFDAMRAAAPKPNGNKHLTLNSVISVEGDTANAVSDLVAARLSPDGWAINGIGQYRDEIVRHEGEWKIRRRTVVGFRGMPLHPTNPEFDELLHKTILEVLAED